MHWMRTALALVALIALFGCSTDSPTAPVQDPVPPGGGAPPGKWIIIVNLSPRELTAGAPDPSTISIRVRLAENNNPPPSGTTMVVQTSLGDLLSAGSGISSTVVTLVNGRAQLPIFAGAVSGSALISAVLENSVGQASLPIRGAIEAVVASFNFQNSNDNLSVVFQNTSTGDPTTFRWDFGDGGTSSEENPTHVFGGPGDFVVSLTASKRGSSDTTSRIVTIREQEEVVAGFDETIDGLTVVFRDTSTGDPDRFRWDFGDGTTSTEQNPTHTYRSDGIFVVVLNASNAFSSDDFSKTLDLTRDFFIQLISPDSGPAAGGTSVTITGRGFQQPLRVLFGAKLAVVNSVSSTQIIVTTPTGDLAVEACDGNSDGIADGERKVDTPVAVVVEPESGRAETIPNGFTYLTPSTACVGG